MKKKSIIIIAVVVLALAGGGYYVRQSIQKKQAAAAQASFATTVAKRAPLDVVVTGTANIVPREKTTVKAMTTGLVSRVLIDEGQPVKEGQAVLSLENQALNAAFDQAAVEASSARARLQSMQAPTNADRAQAEARVQQAEAQLISRRNDVQKLTITSPATGHIGGVRVNNGDAVIPGQSLIFVVDDVNTYVIAMVAQADLPKVAVGQAVSLGFGGDLPIAQGVVESIGMEAAGSGSSTTMPVKVRFQNTSGLYRTGLAANTVIKVGREDNRDITVSAPGTVTPQTRFELKAEVAGNVLEVLVKENDSVAAGQVLVRIKSDTAAALVQQAESDLLSARESLANVKTGLVPNTLRSDIEQQDFRVRQAEAVLRARAADVDYLQAKSPIDGTVVAKHVNKGEMVIPGTSLFTVADYSKMTMVISVDELDIQQVKVGQQASIHIGAVGRSVSGQVTKIASEGNMKDGVASYDVTVTLNETKDLRGAMTGTAKIMVTHKDNVIAVPSEAVIRAGERIRVYVLKNGQPTAVDVTIGATTSLLTEIVTGIEVGDLVILSTTDKGANSLFSVPKPSQETDTTR